MPIVSFTASNKKEVEQLGYEYKAGHLQSSTAIYGHVNEHMEEDILSALRKIYDAFTSYNQSEGLPNDEAVENIAERLRESMEHARKNKLMLSLPCHIDVFKDGEKLSIIEYSMKIVRHLMEYDANVTEIGRSKLHALWLEISKLVSNGNNVRTSVFYSERTPSILQKRESYLLNLKQIVLNSIENDKKDNVIVERDNEFYYVKCSAESVVTPTKFMNSSEFKDLKYGALQIGEGSDVIRIQNGQYCDIKGVLKMIFALGDEKIKMILFSENTSGFGKITVFMDDKSCEIFSRYRETLKKEPHISKVIEAAESFVQKNKTVSPPPISSMNDTNIFNHLENIAQGANKNAY